MAENTHFLSFKGILQRIKMQITRNFWLKIISFILAFFVWLSISGGPKTERTINVQLDLGSYIPKGWALSEDYIKEVEIRLNGKDTTIQKMNDQDVSLSFSGDLIAPLRTTQRIVINTDNILLPAGVSVLNIFPREILIKLDESIEVEKNVKVITSGDLPSGFILYNDPMPIPATMKISGARSVIDLITEIPVNLNFSDLVISSPTELSFTNRIQLNPLINYGGVAEVEVILDIIEVRQTKRFNVDTFDFRGLKNREQVVNFAPRKLTWEVTGPSSWIEALTAEELSIYIDLSVADRDKMENILLDNSMLRFEEPYSRPELVNARIIGSRNELSYRIETR